VLTYARLVVRVLLADLERQTLPEQEHGILYAAALLHDVDNLQTMPLEDGRRITHRSHSRKGAIAAVLPAKDDGVRCPPFFFSFLPSSSPFSVRRGRGYGASVLQATGRFVVE